MRSPLLSVYLWFFWFSLLLGRGDRVVSPPELAPPVLLFGVLEKNLSSEVCILSEG